MKKFVENFLKINNIRYYFWKRFLTIVSAQVSENTGSTEASSSYIDVTTTEKGGDTVKGSPIITAVPTPDKPVAKIIFSAKAINEAEALYYPYAPISSGPFSWSWATGDPWVPDGDIA